MIAGDSMTSFQRMKIHRRRRKQPVIWWWLLALVLYVFLEPVGQLGEEAALWLHRLF